MSLQGRQIIYSFTLLQQNKLSTEEKRERQKDLIKM